MSFQIRVSFKYPKFSKCYGLFEPQLSSNQASSIS